MFGAGAGNNFGFLPPGSGTHTMLSRVKQHPAQLFDRRAIMRPNRGVADQGDLFAQRLIQGGAPLRAVENLAFDLSLPEQIDHRQGFVQQTLQRRGPARPYNIIRVFPPRHHRKAHR